MAHKRFLSKYDDQKIWWLRFTKSFLLFAVILIIVFTLVIGVSHVSGSSMYPTLTDGQIVVYLRLDKSYEIGDIISVRMPNGEYYVKRVVAVAGDTVEIRDGALYVNGQKENAAYANGLTEVQEGVNYPLTIKDGKVFAIGDNREGSIDSRTFGPFAVSQTRGRILFVN